MAAEIGHWSGSSGSVRKSRNAAVGSDEGWPEFDERQRVRDDAVAAIVPRTKAAPRAGRKTATTRPAVGVRKDRRPTLAVSRHEDKATHEPESSDGRRDGGGRRHDGRHERPRDDDDDDDGRRDVEGELDRARTSESKRRASPATAAQFANDSKRSDRRTAPSRSSSRTAASAIAAADRVPRKRSRRKLTDGDGDGDGDDRAASRRQAAAETLSEGGARRRDEDGEDERFFRVAPQEFAAAADRVGARNAVSSKRATDRKLSTTWADAHSAASAAAPTVRRSEVDVPSPPPPPPPPRNASKTVSRVQVEEPHTVWNQLRKFIHHIGAATANDDGGGASRVSEADDPSGAPKKRRKKPPAVAPPTVARRDLAGDPDGDGGGGDGGHEKNDGGDAKDDVQERDDAGWKNAPAAEPPQNLRQRWRNSAVDVWRRPQTRILLLLAAAWLVNLQRVCCDAAVGLAYPLYATYVVLRRVRVAHVHVGTLELWLIYFFLYAIWTWVADQLVYFFGGSFAPIYHVLKAAALAALYLPGGWRGALWSTASRRRAFDADRDAFARRCFERVVVRAVAGGERVAARLFGAALNVEIDDASHLSVMDAGDGNDNEGGGGGNRNDGAAKNDDDRGYRAPALDDRRDSGASRARKSSSSSSVGGRASPTAANVRTDRGRSQPTATLTLPPRQATDWDSLHARDLEATLDGRSRNGGHFRSSSPPPPDGGHRDSASGAANSFSDMVRSQLSAAVGNIAHATANGIAQRARESRPELVAALGLLVNGGRGDGGGGVNDVAAERNLAGADADARRWTHRRVPDAHRHRPGTDDEA